MRDYMIFRIRFVGGTVCEFKLGRIMCECQKDTFKDEHLCAFNMFNKSKVIECYHATYDPDTGTYKQRSDNPVIINFDNVVYMEQLEADKPIETVKVKKSKSKKG